MSYEVTGLPDGSGFKVGAYSSTSFTYTPVYGDPFLGEGGLALDSGVFIDIDFSMTGISSIKSATLSLYGRSYATSSSGSFDWNTFDGAGSSGTISNVPPYHWDGTSVISGASIDVIESTGALSSAIAPLSVSLSLVTRAVSGRSSAGVSLLLPQPHKIATRKAVRIAASLGFGPGWHNNRPEFRARALLKWSAMTRGRLQHLLSSALFAALTPACGATVIETGGTEAGPNDANTDTGTPPIDTGACTPVAVNTACNESVDYPCGLPFAPSSPPTNEECQRLCAPVKFTYMSTYIWCSVGPTDAGATRVYCTSCAVGRKPADLLEDEGGCEGEDPVATALAEMARIEAASVHAFRRLERSLGELGADDDLRARARRAARDEIKHARSAARLARMRGARPRPVRLARERTPTTFELAMENAVAGCVHETLGVAYLEHQRTHAADPELRALAASLYDDELEHAALSWDLVAFFDRRLDAEERSQLRAATARALDDVVEEIGRVHPRVRDALGLPQRETVARMVANLRETLFS